MNDSIVVWLAIALLLFWAMGAYNRLVRLRSQGIVAFGVLEGLFNQLLILVKTHSPEAGSADSLVDASRPHDEAATAWMGLVAATEQFSASLKVAHGRPLHGPTTSALKTAFDTLCLSWSRLRSLPSDLAGPALPGTLLSQWEHVAFQTDMARTEFNRQVSNYNEAISQFPAMVLAWLFGFKPAQPV